MQNKPVVQYIGAARFFRWVDGEEYARVYGIDHPILGEQEIRTSLIVMKHDDGSFETMNTFYVPVKDNEVSTY